MSRCVVDTNVAIVANGRPSDNEIRRPAIACRLAAVEFLREIVEQGTVLLDSDGEIQSEYRSYLHSRGQPGVGDRFYQVILNSSPRLVERVELPKRNDGEYQHLPQSLVDAGFDPSDRKFVALALKEGVSVHNATDSDWIEHAQLLSHENVDVNNLCGCDTAAWFT